MAKMSSYSLKKSISLSQTTVHDTKLLWVTLYYLSMACSGICCGIFLSRFSSRRLAFSASAGMPHALHLHAYSTLSAHLLACRTLYNYMHIQHWQHQQHMAPKQKQNRDTWQNITEQHDIHSNPLKWIALGRYYQYPHMQSIHLSMIIHLSISLHCV